MSAVKLPVSLVPEAVTCEDVALVLASAGEASLFELISDLKDVRQRKVTHTVALMKMRSRPESSLAVDLGR